MNISATPLVSSPGLIDTMAAEKAKRHMQPPIRMYRDLGMYWHMTAPTIWPTRAAEPTTQASQPL